jgi:formylglycine-generating enzyme required for sulfatase activity
MVWIEPGTFMMGSPEDEVGRDDDEGPQHEVTITQGFYLGRYELTQEQWTSVMGTTPWSGQDYVQERASNPAAFISWDDIQAFIGVLNETEGSEVYRLPTEAEWEYVCRAGTTTLWSFGDDESVLGEYAWYGVNARNVGEEYAHAVGTKLPNPWGLYDMHGNVHEWCHDWYSDTYYSESPSEDPPGSVTGSSRVFRGGSFYHHVGYARSAGRDHRTPGLRDGSVGARLVRQEPQ